MGRSRQAQPGRLHRRPTSRHGVCRPGRGNGRQGPWPGLSYLAGMMPAVMAINLLPADMVPPYASVRAWARFRAKTVATSRHELWLGAISADGYGRFHDPDYGDQDLEAGQRSGIVRVSRWMWWAWHGPIPSRLVVMHGCGRPICVRLECLQRGTQGDKLRMAAVRNRVARRGAGGRLDYADRRGQAAQSRAIRAVARAAIAAGVTDPDLLDGILTNVIAAGDLGQLVGDGLDEPVELGVHADRVGLVVDRVQQRLDPRPGG